jgi:hypothetical protein
MIQPPKWDVWDFGRVLAETFQAFIIIDLLKFLFRSNWCWIKTCFKYEQRVKITLARCNRLVPSYLSG